MLASECPSAALMEDDIDWRSGDVTDSQPAREAVNAQQPWTVQFLEASGNAEDAAVNPGNVFNFVANQTASTRQTSGNGNAGLSRSVKSLHDEDPVKHRTETLIEDDIKWD